MGTAKKSSAREKKPAAAKQAQKSDRQHHTLSLGSAANELLLAICKREHFDPDEFLHQLVMAGLEKYRLPFNERPDISRIMKLIHSYRSPLELRVEHWRYQDQPDHPALQEQVAPAAPTPAAAAPPKAELEPTGA